MKAKISDVVLATAMISLALMVQAGMIACDVYEKIREKVKGPRGIS